jgi:hypothetical protein
MTERGTREDTGEHPLVLVACPFCGDRMRVNNSRLIVHATQGDCIIGALAWDESKVDAWNHRENAGICSDEQHPIVSEAENKELCGEKR